MTGHWIDQEWHLHDVLLDVVEVKDDHSGRNIAKHIVKSLNDFDVRKTFLNNRGQRVQQHYDGWGYWRSVA